MRRGPPRYDIPKAAPGPLRTVQELVNTVDLEHGRDWLGTPTLFRDWLVERRLLAPGARVRRGDFERALEVREALRALLGVGEPDIAQAALERAARAAKLTLRLEDGHVFLVPAAGGVAGALGQMLVTVHAAMHDGSWSRLKTCRNCRWAFYDYSKNRSAAWCSMRLCGNRTKTRSYYRRRRGAPARSSPPRRA
jgi:CGNR zinc finger/Putative stress-induced transcription regulator